MKQLTLFFVILLMSGCGRNLKEDIHLVIDETNTAYNFSAPNNGAYIRPGDAENIYNDLIGGLRSDFNEKGNDVTVMSSGDFTLKVVEVNFGETIRTETVSDPCDGAPLSYQVSVISGSMTCEIMDNTGWDSETITVEAESDEDVKKHPTLIQYIIGNDSCYTPRVSNAHPDAVKRRLVRRMYKRVMQSIRSMQ